MQAVPSIDRVVTDIVRDAGGRAATGRTATVILTEREVTIAANIREFAVSRGLTDAQVDAVFSSAGLSFRPAQDPAVTRAAARIASAEADLAAARADLAAARR